MLASLLLVSLLSEQLKINEETLGERALRNESKIPLVPVSLMDIRKRKPLTEEQLEERKRKVCWRERGGEGGRGEGGGGRAWE